VKLLSMKLSLRWERGTVNRERRGPILTRGVDRWFLCLCSLA
jgi:hypothetical protein